jgi:hypothetical protein
MVIVQRQRYESWRDALMETRDHIHGLDLDISHLLDQWDYKAGQVVARKFTGRDGKERIQLRVDLGVLQMHAEGRPDGKRPFGHECLFDLYQSRFYKHLSAHDGNPEGFKLNSEDCAKLQLEALQYHHRYICLLQLADYEAVVRDGEHNLEVFTFVGKHAESADLAWSLQQFQPQLLMILTRARALQAMETDDFESAIELVKEGVDRIREFYREHAKADLSEQSSEVHSLENWLTDIRARRPLSTRERLELALSEAVQREDYEKAAQMRDALRNLKSGA